VVSIQDLKILKCFDRRMNMDDGLWLQKKAVTLNFKKKSATRNDGIPSHPLTTPLGVAQMYRMVINLRISILIVFVI
jgi:hypothetical protein